MQILSNRGDIMADFNSNMQKLGTVRSVIRETFEYGNKRAKEIGRENVFDYSLGNPSVSPPEIVDKKISELVSVENTVSVHGYNSAQGAEDTRIAIADDINSRFSAGITKDDIYITCGAAASLTVTLNALVCPGDEIMVIAPFFPEYRVFAETAGAKVVIVPADLENFQINFSEMEKLVTANTKAVIINTPNNPTGAVFSKETIKMMCELLENKQKEFNKKIFLISDEPYRELVYDDIELPYLTNCYNNTIVCYSYSKSLSLPGERIGYIVVSNKIDCHNDIYAAVCGAGRALGFVCAPSMMQKVIKDCVGKTADVSIYRKNRDLLYNALTDYGYECVHPDGAFYLFVKSLDEDANTFCLKARDYELLLVPSDSFGCKGYIRLSYCVSTEMIEKSLPAFKKLIESYK